MRLSEKECVELYHRYNNPNMRRWTDEEYNRLAEEYPKIKNHIERQRLAERTKRLLHQFLHCLFEAYTTVENDGSFAMQRVGNTLYLWFQCSDGLTDWVNNFNFPAKPYRHMSDLWFCHRGFLKVWKSIEPYVSTPINDPTITRIEIVGYSHGAAVAALCYEYVKYNRPDVNVSGVGFGGPRVLWGFAGKRVLDRFKDFVLVRNGRDIVTHLPPAVFGFRHVGKIVKIGSKSKGLIDDHRPENYIESMEEYHV